MQHREVSLDDKFTAASGRVMMTGIQALVRLMLDQKRLDTAAGLDTAGYVSGYRGSPLGGLDQQMRRSGKLLAAHDVVFQEGLNEELGATAVWGSQQLGLFPGARKQGVFGMWYGKAPGVDRTGDVFKHANFAGTSPFGGVLAVAGDDHTCKSSTLPSQSEFAFADAEIPVLNPSSIQEVLDFGMAGWAMSRFSGLWTGLIALADTMDSAAVVEVGLARHGFIRPQMDLPPEGLGMRRGDQPMDKERRLRSFKLPAARAFVRANRLDRTILESLRPRIGIVTTGQAARDIFEAFDALGLSPEQAAAAGFAIYKVAMPWPLEPDGIMEFARGVETLLVVEHKRDLMESQIRSALYHLPDAERPRVIGKRDETGAPLLSDLSAIAIPALARVLFDRLPDDHRTERGRYWLERAEAQERLAVGITADVHRKAHYCSGCPHNTSTVVPEGSRALAGIGCHYMATFMDRSTDMTSQMGGEGVAWLGQAPFTDEKHLFVNLGDGTYCHSGSLAIRAAVAAGATITYKLLYNDAVAMTGGQRTESGQTVPQIVRQLLGEGVAKVVVVADDPSRHAGKLDAGVECFHRSRLDEVQRSLREMPGVTVLVYDQVCAAEKRRRIKRGLMQAPATRAFINPAVCEGCGDCSKQSNCLSIAPLETDLGTKREIDQSSCNQDLRCVDGFCPSFVTITGSENAAKLRTRPDFDATLLPLPEPVSLDRPWSIVFTGVGGTGVTTIAAILAMAAHVDGNAATSLDMTGLAQKGGPVLSHVRIARAPDDIRSPRTPPTCADAVIAGDLVVATSLDALSLTHRDHTRAVANLEVTPTSEFITDRTKRFTAAPLARKLSAGVAGLDTVDAKSLAESVLFDAVFGNMVLLGYAWQRGLVPVTLRGLYRAIKLNGADVANNIAAFDLGRVAAAEPERLESLKPAPVIPVAERPIEEIVTRRVAHLTGWQDAAYAARYADLVARVQAAEAALGLKGLAKAVALNAAKVMAYKDEYEVARLYTDGSFRTALGAAFSGDMKLKVWLAPPLFAPKDRATGVPKKIAFGGWIFPVFGLLAKLKGLREGPLDVFGRTEERRAERALRDRYLAGVERLIEGLTAANHALALEIASLPDAIRGFGHVKEAAMAKAAETEAALWARWDATPAARAA